ncbi:putative ribonuclease H-like domain-containing protein [Tanacetum coccineum]
MGHFARECKNQDNKNRNYDSSRRTVNVEEISSKSMLAIDGAGFDWSYMADDEVPTNMALMAFSDSKPEFEGYGPKTSKNISEDTSNEVRESLDAPLVKKLVSNDKLTTITIKGIVWNMAPRVVLMKSGLRPLNTVRHVNTAHPRTRVYSARPMPKAVNTARPNSAVINVVRENQGHPQKEDQGYVDSGCSRHMTCNMSYLLDFKEFDEGYVTFGGGVKGGRITGKRTLKTGKLDFEDVFFVKVLQFNLFSVSQMCDKKNSVLFTVSGCFVMSYDFKLADESQVLLKVPRKNNMYSVDIKNIIPKESLTCLVVKATLDESILWYRRLGHVNFKTINKLVKDNLVRGLPTKCFENDQTCIACLKGKQHKASCKFDGKSDDGVFVGYLLNSEAFQVYNIRTRKVEENLHVRFLKDKLIIAGDGPKWLFDIDVLTKSKNYVPVVAGTNSNYFVGTKESIGAGHSSKELESSQDYILMTLWKDGLLFDSSSKNASNNEPQPSNDAGKKDDEGGINDEERPENYAQDVNTAGPNINTASINTGSLNINTASPTVIIAQLKATHADFLGVQTRRMTNEQGFISVVYEGKTHKDLHTCLFACFLSQEEPKKVIQALKDPSWIEAMQEELLQFKLQQVWTLGYTQEEGIDYDEVFGLVARIEAIRLFLAYASFKDFVVYQMDVKSAFLHGKIKEKVYVCQPLGFEYPEFLDKVYKVEKVLYGVHQAPRAWYETLSTYLLDNGFQRGQIDKTLFIKRIKSDILLVQVYVDDIIFGSTKKELCIRFEKLMHKKFQMCSMGELTFFLGLQVTKKDDGIFISQDKYVDDILKKFGFSTVKTSSTPMETSKPLLKDAEVEDVNVHLYRSMIGSLMYLTASRPNIMFDVCACARFQVTPKGSHLYAVKRIFIT